EDRHADGESVSHRSDAPLNGYHVQVGEATAAASKAHARRDQDSLPQFQQIGKQSCGFSDGHASLRGKGPTSFSELRHVARHLETVTRTARASPTAPTRC